ncbi:response regulator [Paenibacillus sp. MBLB4367]|uniref:response regulator transcription factor n=1 Tax=Paenibacillus sp. MBLB4367 TaxID=3384767 RepID=UPI0039083994
MYQVIVAEDEVWIRKAIVEMIERNRYGFKVVGEAADGEEAWALVNELWPTVLITDIMMPNRDGLWVIRNIAEHKLPVVPIIISGYDQFEYAQQAIRYNVSEYLLKPVDPEELESALQRSLDRLTNIKELNGCYLRIQSFVDGMPTMDQKQLLTEQAALVKAILRMKDVQDGARIGMLRIFAGKLGVMHGSEEGCTADALTMEADHIREDEVRHHFHKLVETWIQSRRRKGDYKLRLSIKQACDYVKQNYMHDVTLKKVAERSELSLSYFSTIFKQYAGESFVNYLNQTRIEQAKLLLLESDMKIYEVAEMVGFASLHYFNRVFKTVAGMAPNEYRRSIGL